MASDTWVDNYAPQSRGRKSAVAQEGMPAAQSFSYRDVTCHAYRGFPSAVLSRDYLSAAPAASSRSGTCYAGQRKFGREANLPGTHGLGLG